MASHKYGAIKSSCGAHMHPSKQEAKRCAELQLLQQAGEIDSLEFQPSFELFVNGMKVCSYRGDWRYNEKGASVVEDLKGMRTPLFKLKKKLMKACLGIEIHETHAR